MSLFNITLNDMKMNTAYHKINCVRLDQDFLASLIIESGSVSEADLMLLINSEM